MENLGKIYVVAVPIGNLGDITLRAIETLKTVDVVYAEDTRVTRKLLSHFNIEKPIERFDDNISDSRTKGLISIVKEGKNIALTSDAGTPNVADPGWRLIKLAVEQGIEVIPIPGPSALTALISISHFSLNQFVFLGFPPHKKGRKKFFGEIEGITRVRPVIMYESTHRIVKTLGELADVVSEREIIVAKEITKMYERVWRGKIKEISDQFDKLNKKELKGEWVIALSGFMTPPFHRWNKNKNNIS